MSDWARTFAIVITISVAAVWSPAEASTITIAEVGDTGTTGSTSLFGPGLEFIFSAEYASIAGHTDIHIPSGVGIHTYAFLLEPGTGDISDVLELTVTTDQPPNQFPQYVTFQFIPTVTLASMARSPRRTPGPAAGRFPEPKRPAICKASARCCSEPMRDCWTSRCNPTPTKPARSRAPAHRRLLFQSRLQSSCS